MQATSLAKLKLSSKDAIYAVRLRELFDRTELCRELYWSIPKDVRISKGLRGDVGDGSLFSGARIVELSKDLLAAAFRERYPIELNLMQCGAFPEIAGSIHNHEELVSVLEPLLSDLEAKLESV